MALREAEAKLSPATTDDFRRQLTACLILVAPTGMTDNDRAEWLRAAWGTLDGIPADLLEAGCEVARETCDHPSKIVPAIIRTVDALWKRRKDDRARVVSALAKMAEPEAEPEDLCTPEQAAEIIKAVGLKMDDAPVRKTHTGDPVAPDRNWYLDHGVSPEDLPEAMRDQAA